MWRRCRVNGLGVRWVLFGIFLAGLVMMRACMRADWEAGEQMARDAAGQEETLR